MITQHKPVQLSHLAAAVSVPQQTTDFSALATAEALHLMNPNYILTGAEILAFEPSMTQGLANIAFEALITHEDPAAARQALVLDTINGDLPGLGGHIAESTLADANYAVQLIGHPAALDAYLFG